jgi:hypothetical protein
MFTTIVAIEFASHTGKSEGWVVSSSVDTKPDVGGRIAALCFAKARRREQAPAFNKAFSRMKTSAACHHGRC